MKIPHLQKPLSFASAALIIGAALFVTVSLPPDARGARPIEIWTQKKFKNRRTVVGKEVCFPKKNKDCHSELGGWMAKEIAFRFNYGPGTSLRNQTRAIELRVKTKYLVTESTRVEIRLGNRKVGGMTIRSTGDTRTRLRTRNLRGRKDLRLIVPGAQVGIGKQAKGFILSRVRLVGIR